MAFVAVCSFTYIILGPCNDQKIMKYIHINFNL